MKWPTLQQELINVHDNYDSYSDNEKENKLITAAWQDIHDLFGDCPHGIRPHWVRKNDYSMVMIYYNCN